MSSSATSTDFLSIATRIQERAIQLNHERTILSESKNELSNLQAIVEKEANENAIIKQRLLETQNKRNGIEMQVFDTKKESTQLQEKTKALVNNAVEIKQQSNNMLNRWKETAEENIISKHIIRRECYKRKVLNDLCQLKENRKKRQNKIDNLCKKTDEAHKDASKLHKEREILRIDLRSLDEVCCFAYILIFIF